MRIKSVSIENFRGLERLDLDLDDYTALIGVNGAGKSSVLYALDWFFNDRSLHTGDIHGHSGDPEADLSKAPEITVTVTFTDLADPDRNSLEKFGAAANFILRRTWRPQDGRTRFLGLAPLEASFSELRAPGITLPELRRLFRNLQEDLPGLGTDSFKERDKILATLNTLENHYKAIGAFDTLDYFNADDLFGPRGRAPLSSFFTYLLVPADVKLATETGETAKGTLLTQLLGDLVSRGTIQVRQEWESTNQDELESLRQKVIERVETELSGLEAAVNDQLAPHLPDTQVKFESWLPPVTLKLEPDVNAYVSVDGTKIPVGRHGHGVQRALLIAMLQAAAGQSNASGTGTTDSAPPGLLIGMEEPELYQHPVRARAFARVLTDAASSKNTQVIMATHSPYFVRPDQFSSLRRLSVHGAGRRVSQADREAIQGILELSTTKFDRALARLISTRLSESFFAEAVVLVEGETDQVIFEALAELHEKPFGYLGIEVMAVSGKTELGSAFAILRSLDIATYVVFDGDFSTAQRKHPDDETKRREAYKDHMSATTKLVEVLQRSGVDTSYNFGEPTFVGPDFAVWRDDLEEELTKWPSFTGIMEKAHIDITARTNKYAHFYLESAIAAQLDDMPANLSLAVEAIFAILGRDR